MVPQIQVGLSPDPKYADKQPEANGHITAVNHYEEETSFWKDKGLDVVPSEARGGGYDSGSDNEIDTGIYKIFLFHRKFTSNLILSYFIFSLVWNKHVFELI